MAAATGTQKVKLLDSVLLPAPDGRRAQVEHKAGETVAVPAAVAARLLRIGLAEKG